MHRPENQMGSDRDICLVNSYMENLISILSVRGRSSNSMDHFQCLKLFVYQFTRENKISRTQSSRFSSFGHQNRQSMPFKIILSLSSIYSTQTISVSWGFGEISVPKKPHRFGRTRPFRLVVLRAPNVCPAWHRCPQPCR